MCGYNERRYNEKGGIIENSFNEGTVSGTGDYDVLNIGGVCGYNYGGTIKSCYNTASVSGQYSVGGVSGSLGSDVTNCYYLSGTVADGKSGIGGQKDENGKAEKMSLEQFKSGEVAWLLNGSKSVSTEESTLAWYQKLDENADAYPVLKSTDHNTVYKAPLFSCNQKATSCLTTIRWQKRLMKERQIFIARNALYATIKRWNKVHQGLLWQQRQHY